MAIRDWEEYLSNKLSFPFIAKRIDDADNVVWEGLKNDKPFGFMNNKTPSWIDVKKYITSFDKKQLIALVGDLYRCGFSRCQVLSLPGCGVVRLKIS